MKVNADLLAKYHENRCTPEERTALEAWLLSSDVDDLEFHSEKDKQIAKADIWEELDAILPKEEVVKVAPNFASFYMWKGAIAASLVIGLFGLSFYYFNQSRQTAVEFVAFHNKSSLKVNHISSKEYNLTIAPETFAEVNRHSGIIELSGSILISPKKDIELSFDGEKEKVKLKGGQTYIILNSKTGNHGLIIVNEKNLISLPPVIQKKLIQEFDI
ncbi:hypothetical protein OQZ33_21720 [Pedobacter sp. MC2016-05]|uniref:hypothetical protein n=1 Tax=Pedobacter sp. MC2016-05 TaxID=2994474 RepID=UPI002246E14B|nr:hypothetical protein [Pedobacter sp. MC2016-05]MCX2476967.1 hypothetical protein [Pedobacter sp. MC2016-05]